MVSGHLSAGGPTHLALFQKELMNVKVGPVDRRLHPPIRCSHARLARQQAREA